MNTNTVEYMSALPAEKKLELLKAAKFGTWYDGWTPYCVCCSYGDRMLEREYGFQCPQCRNMIGWDCMRLVESPLNNPNHKPVGLYPDVKR